MTTTTHPDLTLPTARRLLRFDSLLCLGSGALLALGAPALTDLAGVEARWPTIAAGAFLLVLGAGLAALARAGARRVASLLPWSGEGDLLWAVGSVAVAVLVDLTGPGRALLLAQAVVVAAIGVMKLGLARQLRPAPR